MYRFTYRRSAALALARRSAALALSSAAQTPMLAFRAVSTTQSPTSTVAPQVSFKEHLWVVFEVYVTSNFTF